MSHFLEMKTTMRDPIAIKRALIRMGIDANAIEISESLTINEYNGRTQLANIAVRKKYLKKNFRQLGLSGYHAYSDIGFVRQSDGSFNAIVDNINASTTWMNKLTMYYNIEKTKMELDLRRISYRETSENGLPVIIARIPQKMERIERSVVFN